MDHSGRRTANRLRAASYAALAAIHSVGLSAVSAPPAFLWLPVASIVAAAANSTAAQPATVWKDGTWSGVGSCRHGDIHVSVIVRDGRIQSAAISKCLTRYSCHIIDRLPPEVAQRQKPDKLDVVTGATESSDAFYYAVVDALKHAK